MIYSPRAQPEAIKSRIHEVPKNNCLIFHMDEVAHRAPVGQLVKHRAVTREVVSSTRAGPTLRV